jgi:predicted transposase/invertase (TIGR01784 family)
MKTDALLYRLLQDHPDLVFELAGLPLPNADYKLVAEEIKETHFRLDGVLIPSVMSQESPLVFLESQFQSDSDFYARWFASIFLYLRRHPERRWWRAVALFPGQSTDTGQPLGYEELLFGTRVNRVYLEALLDVEPASPGIRLIQLLLAKPTEALAKAQAFLGAAPPTWPDFPNWVETVLIYKLPRLTREEIRIMLHLIDVDLKDTRFYQEVFAEGAKVGHKEGCEEGRREGEANLLLRLLKRRLGNIAPDQEAIVRALPETHLEALGEALLDFSKPEDFSAWLARHPSA